MVKRIAIFLIAVVLVSCGPRLVYPHLDWLIPWYLSDYISFDSDQKTMLEDRLSKLLNWHCQTQLPAYATTLRDLKQDLARHSGQLNPALLQAYSARLTALWKELLQQVEPDITAMLATATDAQIDELFVNLEEQNQKFKEEYVDPPPDELVQNRAERMVKRAKYLISKLNSEQKQMVTDWSAQLTPIAKDWLENRRVVQAEARRLLANRHTDPGFKDAMQEFIINPERRRSPDYQHKIDINTTVTLNFLVKLDRLLTTKQRAYLLDRLDSLAADFDALARSCNPATTPKPERDYRLSQKRLDSRE